MKRSIGFLLVLSLIHPVFSQEWKQLIRQPGTQYKNVLQKFYQERNEEMRARQQAIKNEKNPEEKDDEFRQEWAALMMLGDRLNPDGTIPNVGVLNLEAEFQLQGGNSMQS